MYNNRDNRFHAWTEDSKNDDVEYRRRTMSRRYGALNDPLKFFSELPAYVLEKIYREYLEPEILWETYKEIINHYSSKKLCIQYIRPRIVNFLVKPNVCEYFSKKCNGWKYSYDLHKKKENKSFCKCSKGDSFCLTILMFLYH